MKRVLRYALMVCAVIALGLALNTGRAWAADERKLELNAAKITIYVGNNYQLELLNRLTDEEVTFKSKKKSIAKVTADGMITGVKEGSTTITATCKGKSYSCKVTVKAKNDPGNVVYSGATFGEDDEYVYYLDTEVLAPQGLVYGYHSGGYLCKVRKDGTGKPEILMKDCCYKPMLVGNYVYYLYCWSTLYYDLNKFYWCCRIKTDGTGAEVLTGKEYSVYDYTVYDNVLYCSMTDDDYRVNGKWIPVKTGIYSINLSNKKMKFLSPRESTIAYHLSVANGRLYYVDYATLNHMRLGLDRGEYLFSMNLDGTGEKLHDRLKDGTYEYYSSFISCGSYMYYVNYDNYLSRVKLDGTGTPEKLHKVYGALAVKGDWIYAADYAVDKFESKESGGIVRVNTKTKEVEKLLDGLYYPDHVYKNRLYLSTSEYFSFGDLSVFGYNGSKWGLFTEKIDFATLNKIKKIKSLPDTLEKGAVKVTPLNSDKKDHAFDIGTSMPGVPSFVTIDVSDFAGGSGLKMMVGETKTINITGRSIKANVSYSVADKSIASVDKDGVVTARKAGETSIKVVYNYNMTFNIRVRIVNTQEEKTELLKEKEVKQYNESDDLMTKIGRYERLYGLRNIELKRVVVITEPSLFLYCLNGEGGDTSDGKKAIFNSKTPLEFMVLSRWDWDLSTPDEDVYLYTFLDMDHYNYLCVSKEEEGADVMFESVGKSNGNENFHLEAAENDCFYLCTPEKNLYIYSDNGMLKVTKNKGKALLFAFIAV